MTDAPAIDVPTLGPWLETNLPGCAGVRAITQFSTGQSNPTYRVEAKSGTYVLRAKPPGDLLPSAHAVDREFRVMRALAGTGVPVPQVLVLADAASPLGRDFFVMEHLEGRIFWDPTLPDLDRAERAAVYAQMGRVLADLHQVDVEAVGLGDFGKPGGYFARQLGRWTKQYRAAERAPKPAMDTLIAWLKAALPEEDGDVSLVHGDYRLDNMIFAPDAPRVLGLLDWELSTLGHPMADLAYQCMQWRMPYNGPLKGLGGVDRAALGLPSEADYVAAYAQRRGIAPPKDWTFYLAFAFFRFAAILEGVGARADQGNAAQPQMALAYGAMVPDLAAQAMDLVEGPA